MKRLSSAVLSDLPERVSVPAYDRAAVGIGIVHLGIGAFHRAHQAVYTDDVLAKHGGDWAISGVSLRSKTVHDQLDPQDGLFSVTALDGEGRDCRIVGSVKEVIFAPDDKLRLFDLMAAPTTRIVSLTVTEKGYYRDPSTGALLTNDPAIRADLVNVDNPATAVGLIVRALKLRRAAGTEPFTVLCCDNLPANGAALRQVVLDYARLHDSDLAAWIEETVRFPSTMVDRIVPATTEEGLAAVESQLDCRDEGAILTEPFTQWVIEDDFSAGRPAWEDVGAMLVDDVAPFEFAKLRLLNGPHSTLAYLGYLAGMEYVSDCMENSSLRRFVDTLMREDIRPTVTAPEGFDVDGYIDALQARFANPELHHRCWQIAMDGSQKLPQRLLGTVRDRLKEGASVARFGLVVAAWIRYASGVDLDGNTIDVRDPFSERFAERFTPLLSKPEALAEAALSMTEIFGKDLSEDATFRTAVTDGLKKLFADGAIAATEL
ncbi:fructuronate reductase [Rhodobium orientis]|uniref:Mannitol dehydrogenase n=1 Tax=Rhodobium orientis TaxID=34017 RepID=A0A327JVD9_9HYPH|nr:mannitol dehydrogenase family protein [Rhodobium orientis]MBB4301001.1 fructuronate reductase [Rhodobium orientis]MBK5949668.1 mannitol dehydrogenase [Rhodobium orientis]RAI30207.1 mannitol dehydrogenase [Rhodobium orientis]